MTTYLIKLRQNIFSLTLVTAGMLSISVAYLIRKIIIFSLEEPLPFFSSANTSHLHQKKIITDPIPDKDEIKRIASGNLLRGTPVNFVEETNIENFNLTNLSLIGVVSGSPRYARVTILMKEEKSVDSYAIGDIIRDGKIVSIRSASVIFEASDGSRFTLSLNEEETSITESQQNRQTQTKQSQGSKTEKITLSRDRFKQLIKNQAELFRLKFAPSIVSGKINGWRLLKVPKNHFLYSMGARSGDIIRRYNGQELENQERMIEMWQSLQSANQVSIDIDRKGTIINYDILIQ